jgi:hypothetical protein
MTVAELIEKLKEFPDDLIVCVDGYEGGYRDIDTEDNFNVIKVHATPNADWYYGDWDEGWTYDNRVEKDNTNILVISR